MRRIAFVLLTLAAACAVAEGSRETGGFSYAGITAIQVEAETFAVTVEAVRDRQVTMEIRNQPDSHAVYHSQSGGQLRVWVERTVSVFPRPHRGELVLRIPETTLLSVETTTGRVSVRGLAADELRVRTSTGEVAVSDLSASMRANTTTGGVTIRNASGRFDLTTTTGSIRLEQATGDVTATSTTGSHAYRNVTGDLEVRSGTGRVELANVRGKLSIRTSTGNQTGRSVLLTGDSRFEASTGSIDMDLVNALETLEFDLKSTTGSLRVGSDRSQRELFLSGTGYRVTARTSTGSQSFY